MFKTAANVLWYYTCVVSELLEYLLDFDFSYLCLVTALQL